MNWRNFDIPLYECIIFVDCFQQNISDTVTRSKAIYTKIVQLQQVTHFLRLKRDNTTWH